ncbi:MAG: 2OG-Fe(II) oxygenase [Cryomorphaceae bacterium]|nr:MAG: 2OG-Fe(II) oxygenase [Cryomorphaceae bacterium]
MLNDHHLDQLAQQHYLRLDGFFPVELYSALRKKARALVENDEMERAGIGSGAQFEMNKRIRGDEVFWLNRQDEDPVIQHFWKWIQDLSDQLNRAFFLGIRDAEFHFAHYPKGAYYRPHFDQFKDRNNRLISFILYMNDQWQSGHGGELVIHNKSEKIVVEPLGNRVAMFRSDAVLHEVLEAHQPRLSLTGWFTSQPLGLGFLT